MDQLLLYLAAINGHSNVQLLQMNPDVTPMPETPNSTSSEDSSELEPVRHQLAMTQPQRRNNNTLMAPSSIKVSTTRSD